MELVQAQWLIREGREHLESQDGQVGYRLTAPQLSLLREQTELRRRSSMRFPDPQNWLWTTRSLAQASDWWCAKFKASLFPPQVHVADGCCGAGVDLVALAMRGLATGIDRDPVLVELANANLAAHNLPPTAVAGELPKDFSRQTANGSRWLHLDPDRRATNSMDRRLRKSEDFNPSLSESFEMMRLAAGAILKLAPGTVIDPQVESAFRNEVGLIRCWLGNLGECRQQLLLTGELAASDLATAVSNPTGQANFRAAVLCEPNVQAEVMSGPFQETHMGELNPRRFVYDCHPVLHAAQLQSLWAESVGAQPLGTSQGYFTSDLAVNSAWAQRFEVVDVLPWDQRRVKRWLREHQIGEVEVKKRLLQLDANEHQRQLRGAGDAKITLLITRLGERVRAVIARRV
jgi:THUMP domain-like